MSDLSDRANAARILRRLLACSGAVLVVLALAGCSGDGNGEEGAAPTTVAETTAETTTETTTEKTEPEPITAAERRTVGTRAAGSRAARNLRRVAAIGLPVIAGTDRTGSRRGP